MVDFLKLHKEVTILSILIITVLDIRIKNDLLKNLCGKIVKGIWQKTGNFVLDLIFCASFSLGCNKKLEKTVLWIQLP